MKAAALSEGAAAFTVVRIRPALAGAAGVLI